MKHLVIMVILIALGVSCRASIFSSSLRGFEPVNSIVKRSFSCMYQIHDRCIYDPLSKEDKTHMNRFSRFMKNGFAPDFEQKHITEFYRRYNIREVVNMEEVKLVKKPYFKIEFPKSQNSVIDLSVALCPEFPDSLELPVDRGFFMRSDSHSNLTREQLKQCRHYLTHIHNMYSYAYRNNVPILYSLEKSVLLERFLVILFAQFESQSDFQVSQDANEALDELSRGMRGLVLPHYYTHPSDPLSFYVHQVAGLMFIELEKYRK